MGWGERDAEKGRWGAKERFLSTKNHLRLSMIGVICVLILILVIAIE